MFGFLLVINENLSGWFVVAGVRLFVCCAARRT